MSSIPRVLLYSDAPMWGGGEQYMLELARGLQRAEFQVSSVVNSLAAMDGFAAELARLDISVRRLPAIPRLSKARAFMRVASFFTLHRPDLIHFNLVDPRACNGAMTAAIATWHRRLVVTEHLPESPFDDAPLPFRHRLAARHTALTIVNSDAHRDVVLGRGHNRSEVVVIPNGIQDPGAPNEERRAEARAGLGLGEHAGPVIGFVARLQPQKNPLLFIEGVRRVLPHHPDAVFVILGDGDLRPVMEDRVSLLNLDPAVRFLGWRDNAADLMYGLDLLVNTSRYEGQPLSILEAMLRGVPAVTQDIAGMEDLVADGACGRVVAPQDGDALGAALLDLLGNRERLARMGRAARDRILVLNSIEGMCHHTGTSYHHLLKR